MLDSEVMDLFIQGIQWGTGLGLISFLISWGISLIPNLLNKII